MGTGEILDGSSHTINFQLGSSSSSGLDITGYTSKENACKFYAVMLPVDLSNRPLRFRGLVTHEKDNGDGTKSYTSYSMFARAKAGTAFKSGKGYAMTIEVQSDDSMEFPADADFAVRLGDRWVNFDTIYTKNADGTITINMSEEQLTSMGSDLYFAANATKDVQFDRDGGQLAVIDALVESMYAAQDGTDPIDVDLSNISLSTTRDSPAARIWHRSPCPKRSRPSAARPSRAARHSRASSSRTASPPSPAAPLTAARP